MAGISTEYYIKLEQGQETHPTDQVLDALSRALKLDATANSYLHALARLVDRPAPPHATPAVERMRWLIDSWPMTAAMILTAHCDIVAVNPLMATLIDSYRVGRNALVVLLLEEAMRELYVDWEGLSMRSIALFRSTAGLDPDHPRTREVVRELTRASARFRELWHRHDIAGMTEGIHPMEHPVGGSLSLQYTHLPLVGADDHSLFLYYAQPGTHTERVLAELASGR